MNPLALSHEHYNRQAELLKQGDAEAGEAIFDGFSKKFFRYCMAKTLHRETAEDLTQDVFAKIISRIHQFDANKGNFSPWAWQIVRNTVADYFSRNSKREISVAEFSGTLAQAGQPDFHHRREAEKVMALVKNLSDHDQEIFFLRHVSGMPYKEIAGILGKPEGALRVAIARINQKIRSKSISYDA